VATPLEQLEGKYELLEKIREGGMGSVYKVRHQLLDEVRVIKVLGKPSPGLVLKHSERDRGRRRSRD